jgi:GDP-4-dehydro-6-deoxy-D-mannose reductase
MKNILITGATGFVGSHMVDYILENKKEVKLWATKRYHLSRTDHISHVADRINWVDCNLTDSISVRRMMDKVAPDVIFHFAAESFVSPSWNHPLQYMNVNYGATVNLLESMKEVNSKSYIHIPGSGEEYGEIDLDKLPITIETLLNPVNPYAVTKIAQDLISYVYFKSYGTNVIRTRAFNHEGPRRENVFGIPWYAFQVARIENGMQTPNVITGHLDDERNFTHVKDMVEAYWVAVEKCSPGKLYLVGNSDPKSVHKFKNALEMLIEKSSVKGIIHSIDSRYVRPTQVPYLIADISQFEIETGWKAKISFEDILDDTLEYWREVLKNNPNYSKFSAL